MPFGIDPGSIIIWVIIIVGIIFIYPRFLAWKLGQEIKIFEGWSRKATELIIKDFGKKEKKKVREAVNSFKEFFQVMPVSLDPYGIIRKVERVIDDQRSKFDYFVDKYYEKKNSEEKENMKAALSAAITVHQIMKIIRHYLILAIKYRNAQIAMLLLMQLPIIKHLTKAILRGVRSLSKGMTIGDGIAPLIALRYMENTKELKKEKMIYSEQEIYGRKCIFLKAKGPGGRVGFPGRALEKLAKKYKPNRIITIDAAGKLEGEKSGDVVEGVGVAMGGIGVERYKIEEIATKLKLPLDAIAIKMQSEEAFYSMKKKIFEGVEKAVKILESLIKRTSKDDIILILAVGNTCGVPNEKEKVKKVEDRIKKNIEKMERRKKVKRRTGWW